MNNASLYPDPRRYVQIRDRLRGQIGNGTLKPGDQMPSLSKLAGSFAVSRQTAQHAMQVLANEGPVQFVPGRGYYVCEPS